MIFLNVLNKRGRHNCNGRQNAGKIQNGGAGLQPIDNKTCPQRNNNLTNKAHAVNDRHVRGQTSSLFRAIFIVKLQELLQKILKAVFNSSLV